MLTVTSSTMMQPMLQMSHGYVHPIPAISTSPHETLTPHEPRQPRLMNQVRRYRIH